MASRVCPWNGFAVMAEGGESNTASLIAGPPCLVRLAGAGAMWAEMETVMAVDIRRLGRDRLKAMVIDENVLAKATHSGRDQVWRKLSRRYVMDPESPLFQAFCRAYYAESSPGQRALLGYLLMSAHDYVVRRVSLTWLLPRLERAGRLLRAEELSEHLDALAGECPEWRTWAASSRVRWNAHYLGAVRDFGLATGKAVKRSTPPVVGNTVVAFAARLGQFEGLSPKAILTSDWFALLDLGLDQAVDKLLRLQAEGLARFRIQGDVVELALPFFQEGE